MRHLGWICGCLLIAACSVNPVLEVDGGSGHGGSGGGSGGVTTDGQAGVSGGGSTGGSGGAAGQGGAGGTSGFSCAQIETQYSAALLAARMCVLGASGQCQALVSISLPCPSCMMHVNDATALNALKTQYDLAGCNATPHVCPAIACISPGTGACVPANSGDICQ